MMLQRILSWWRQRKAQRKASRTRLWQRRLKVIPDFEQLEMRLQPSVNASFTAGSYSVHELAGSVGVTVQLSGAVSTASSLHYATSSGSAIAGINYTTTSGTLNWSAGQSQAQVVSIPILHDSAATGTISFTVALSAPTGSIALGSPSTTTVNITDDDPIVSYSASSYTVSAGSTRLITVTLSTHPVSNLTVGYSTGDGLAVAGTDYTSASGTLTFTHAGLLSQSFNVTTLADTATSDIRNVVLSLGTPSAGSLSTSLNKAVLNIGTTPPAGYAVGYTLGMTPGGGPVPLPPLVGAGPLSADVQSGNLSTAVVIPRAPAADPQYDDAAAVQYQPALVYDSDSLPGTQPTLRLTWASKATDPVPTQVKARLTWNGTVQSWVTFSTGGVAAGDTYLIALQAASAVTSTGYYPYTVDLEADFSGAPTVVTRQLKGYLPVGINDGTDGDGWSAAGVDRLVAVPGAVLYVSGGGGVRVFLYQGDHTYFDWPGDLGTLYNNADGTWTYTSPQQVQYNFDGSGYETSVVDPHGLVLSYAYNGSNQISTITEPGGAVYTFGYSGGVLQTVTTPGNLVTTFTQDGSSNLATVAYADGVTLATFAYDAGGNHRLVQETQGGTYATAAYDVTSGTASALTAGAQGSWALTPRLIQGLNTTLQTTAGDVAVVTDPRGAATTYTLNNSGLATEVDLPDGSTRRYTYNGRDQLLTATDGNNHTTTYTYTGIDRTSVKDAAGNLWTFTYDATFHELLTSKDPRGNITTYTIDSNNGDVLTVKDALNHVTTLSWSNGLLQTSTDALGRVTSYAYTGGRLLQSAQDPLLHLVTYGYNSAGDQVTVTDALGITTTTGYDSLHRAVTVTTPDGGVATTLYNGAGLVSAQVDKFGVEADYTYTAAGQLATRTDYAGTSSAQTATNLYDSAGNLTGVQDVRGNLTQFLYDSLNRGTATVDTLNNRTTDLLDAAGNVSGVQDPYGQLTKYLYDSLNRATVTVDVLNNRTTGLYDSAGNLTGSLDVRGNLTQYLFDSLNRQTATVDILSNRTTELFDAAGQLTGALDIRGNLTQFLYDSAGRQSVVIDILGNRTTSLFNGNGQVTEVMAPDGGITQYLYDGLDRLSVTIDQLNYRTTTLFSSLGNVTGTLDARGNLTQFLFDGLNRPTVTIDAASGRVTQLFGSLGDLTGTLDARGNLTQYLYDSYGRQTVVIDAGSNRSTTLYDSYGRVSGSLDANNHLTQFLFDSYGRQSISVDAASGRVTTLFNSYGEVSGTLDARGGLTQFLYDSYGRQSVTIDQANDRATSLYNSYGEVSGTLDGNANLTKFIYDAYGRASVTVDGAGGRATQLYNSLGQVSGSLDGAGNLTQYVYDLLGRATVTIDGNNHRATSLYDGNGNVTGIKDGNNNLTQYQFDALNRQTVSVDGNGSRTTQLYDANGNLTYVKDADNNVTTFAYNGLNQKTSQTDPNSHTTTYSYTATGQLASTTDALGQRIDNQYDSLDRLTTQIWYNGGGTAVNTLTYSYDANGNMLTASNSNGTYTMSYDAAGRVTLAKDLWGDVLTMTYDGAGNRTVVQDNFGGTTTSTYDAANRLATITYNDGTSPLRVDLNYTGAGQLAGMIRYLDTGGTTKVATTSYTYDGAGNVTHLQHKDSTGINLANYTYTYDSGNRVTAEQKNGAAATSYGYDSASQLTSDGVHTFGLDATGNRTYSYDGTTTLSYAPTTGNQISTDGTWNYTYDNAGNETKKVNVNTGVAWTYGYDNKNNLTVAKQWTADPALGGTVTYEVDNKYDPFNNRVEQDSTVTGSSTVVQRFALDGWNPALAETEGTAGWNVWADLNGSNTLQTRYLRGDSIDQLFARVDNLGNPYWPLTDRQGSTRDVINNSAAIKDTVGYDGYGNIISQTAAGWLGRYTWDGREQDDQTGLIYMRRRWYDPATGRWMSPDPIELNAGDNNLYRYVNNRSTNATDPSGLLSLDTSSSNAPSFWPENSRFLLDKTALKAFDKYSDYFESALKDAKWKDIAEFLEYKTDAEREYWQDLLLKRNPLEAFEQGLFGPDMLAPPTKHLTAEPSTYLVVEGKGDMILFPTGRNSSPLFQNLTLFGGLVKFNGDLTKPANLEKLVGTALQNRLTPLTDDAQLAANQANKGLATYKQYNKVFVSAGSLEKVAAGTAGSVMSKLVSFNGAAFFHMSPEDQAMVGLGALLSGTAFGATSLLEPGWNLNLPLGWLHGKYAIWDQAGTNLSIQGGLTDDTKSLFAHMGKADAQWFQRVPVEFRAVYAVTKKRIGSKHPALLDFQISVFPHNIRGGSNVQGGAPLIIKIEGGLKY